MALQAGISHNQSNVPQSGRGSESMADLCPACSLCRGLSQLRIKKPR